MSLFSFSKVFENRNIVYTALRYYPTLMPQEALEVIRKSVFYFLTQIPSDAKYSEVYKEIKAFQEKTAREF